MQTAMAQKLSLSSAPTAAVRKAGARRLPALRVASTTRCQAVSTLAYCDALLARTLPSVALYYSMPALQPPLKPACCLAAA